MDSPVRRLEKMHPPIESPVIGESIGICGAIEAAQQNYAFPGLQYPQYCTRRIPPVPDYNTQYSYYSARTLPAPHSTCTTPPRLSQHRTALALLRPDSPYHRTALADTGGQHAPRCTA
jgi:hypothetical protein